MNYRRKPCDSSGNRVVELLGGPVKPHNHLRMVRYPLLPPLVRQLRAAQPGVEHAFVSGSGRGLSQLGSQAIRLRKESAVGDLIDCL